MSALQSNYLMYCPFMSTFNCLCGHVHVLVMGEVAASYMQLQLALCLAYVRTANKSIQLLHSIKVVLKRLSEALCCMVDVTCS